ncbi:hypothetical protein NC796_22040 [Aliifodinibius sp. S!AR15-10]|uniref:hypothetical protein n=1 Tax=Aliifodinibius sp. S!AR15-10 TaxID=2950437 RepID=UPI002864EEDC|nr:hypothetical protein [Aliifodinibius sp. S!AR15-10]MDR8393850.1 hypothetical protein [Aliifodinibius sp. S!AR15-10]
MRETSYISALCILLLAYLFGGCSQETSPATSGNADRKELTEYEVVPAPDDYLLGLPVRLKYEGATGNLFIQDLDQKKVVEMDMGGEVIAEFGGEGRGLVN